MKQNTTNTFFLSKRKTNFLQNLIDFKSLLWIFQDNIFISDLKIIVLKFSERFKKNWNCPSLVRSRGSGYIWSIYISSIYILSIYILSIYILSTLHFVNYYIWSTVIKPSGTIHPTIFGQLIQTHIKFVNFDLNFCIYFDIVIAYIYLFK